MKIRNIILCIISVLTLFPAKAQWNDISIPVNLPITNAVFIDDLRGYVAAGTEIWRTADGGASWDSTTFTGNIIDVDFSSDMNGCALIQGNGYSQIKLTNDGGDTWNYLDWWGGPFDNYYGLLSTDANNIFISSYNWIIKTHDGGAQWDTISFTGYPMSMDKEKINADTLLFTGWDGTFMYEGQVTRSYDGGNTWTFINTGDNYTNFDGSYFRNGKHGYAVYHRGWAPDSAVIAYTSDGGNSWNEIHYDTAIIYHDILMKNNLEGFVLATENNEGKILSTTDGNNFIEEFSSSVPLYRLFHAENTIYVIGNNGLVMKKYFPLGISNIENSAIPVFPNPATDYFQIENVKGDHLLIYDLNGKIVFNKIISENETISVKDLNSGIYFLELTTNSHIKRGKLEVIR